MADNQNTSMSRKKNFLDQMSDSVGDALKIKKPVAQEETLEEKNEKIRKQNSENFGH